MLAAQRVVTFRLSVAGSPAISQSFGKTPRPTPDMVLLAWGPDQSNGRISVTRVVGHLTNEDVRGRGKREAADIDVRLTG